MKFNFKERIAVFNTLAVGGITTMVFVAIYIVVYLSSLQHLDDDILVEKEEILNSLSLTNDSIYITKKSEWDEEEHRKVEVNPIFIQIVDPGHKIQFKSNNLQSAQFQQLSNSDSPFFYNDQLEGQQLRIGQFPIKGKQGNAVGHLMIGISQQESQFVLHNLLIVLGVCLPLVLIVFYIVIYFSASKAIAPVQRLINSASSITDSNIGQRLPLPENEDELYHLTKTINDLLNRLETRIQQQKQFTADASHEIRTPLSAIRGQLEILLRKRRQPEQYEVKIKEAILQADRLNQLIDQLLQLARMESMMFTKKSIPLALVVNDALLRLQHQIKTNKIHVESTISADQMILADPFALSIMLENLISNAIKYGERPGQITIDWSGIGNKLNISNNGPSIPKEQQPYIFDHFYRTDESRSSLIPGSGLGLAIVKKLADIQRIDVSLLSESNKTTFTLKFPNQI